MMKFLPILFGALLCASHVQCKAVFAHFMVENTNSYTQDTWMDEFDLAQNAHIDAFALNIAKGLPMNDAQIANAFAAADAKGFKLFFSFDYAGQGPWPKQTVLDLLTAYIGRGSYFRHTNGQPLVSTFEGPDWVQDWTDIKSQTGCMFVPDYSSLGAMTAIQQAGDIIDGLFSWAAWPEGPNDSNTFVDASYLQYLRDLAGGKPYMMPVSPWFYTNLPGYSKNWLWRGDSLWFDRWHEVLIAQPEWVEIISWNDFGESHHIGPINRGGDQMVAFLPDHGNPPFNYAENMPHDAWRDLLPYAIDLYKYGTATITHEGLTAWTRPNYASACDNNGTTGNDAAHIQIEYDPVDFVQDKVFFAALLGSPADVYVTSNEGVTQQASWSYTPDGGVGIYRGSADFFGSGIHRVEIRRNNELVVELAFKLLTGHCTLAGMANFNAYVQSSIAGNSISATPPVNVADQGCMNGTSIVEGYKTLCEFTCQRDYCPIEACLCTKKGTPLTGDRGPPGYPAEGLDVTYSGLCAVACSYGFCPSAYCSFTQYDSPIPTVSPFTPKVCTAGSAANGDLGSLCDFACSYGYCPIRAPCVCDERGDFSEFPIEIDDIVTETDLSMAMKGLCDFNCRYGNCPALCTGSDDDEDYTNDDDDEAANDYLPYTDALPSCDSQYTTFDQLNADIETMSENCKFYYTLQVLDATLDAATDKYADMLADNYDKKFDIYAGAVVDHAAQTVADFYNNHGNDYFSCVVTELQWCCAECTSEADCRYCFDGTCWINPNEKRGDPPPGSGANTVKNIFFENVTEPCPPDYSKRGFGAENDQTVFWTLLDDKKDDFWADFTTATGIDQDNIEFGNTQLGGCSPTESAQDCLDSGYWMINVPHPHGYDKTDVGNPKDMVSQALSNTQGLGPQMKSILGDMGMGMYSGDGADLVDSLALLVSMVANGVDNMEQVVEAADKIEEEKQKAILEAFLGAVLFFVPVAGEIMGTIASLANIGRIIALIGEVGNVASDIATIVNDPDNAPLAIFDLVLAPLALGDLAVLNKAATLKRGMKVEDLAKLGEKVGDQMAVIDKITAVCKRT